MKALVTIEFEGLCYYTMKKVKVHKVLTCDGVNFIDKKTEEILINDGKYKLPSTTITAFYQASEYINGQRKFLDSVINDPKQELHCILNWDITSIQNFGEVNNESDSSAIISVLDTPTSIIVSDKPRTIEAKVDSFLPLLSLSTDSEKFKNDFLHTFYEMQESIKDLDADNQFRIVLSAMGVGYSAASNAMQYGIDLLKSISNPDHVISYDGTTLRGKIENRES